MFLLITSAHSGAEILVDMDNTLSHYQSTAIGNYIHWNNLASENKVNDLKLGHYWKIVHFNKQIIYKD